MKLVNADWSYLLEYLKYNDGVCYYGYTTNYYLGNHDLTVESGLPVGCHVPNSSCIPVKELG